MDNSENLSQQQVAQTPLEIQPVKQSQIIKHKPYLIIGGVLLVLVAGIGAYYLGTRQAQQLQLPTQTTQNNNISPSPSAATLDPVYIGNYDVVVKLNPDSPCNTDIYLHSCKSDIYLKDKQSGKETYVLTTEDVVKNDIRVPQYGGGYIFLVKHVGYDDHVANYQGPWTDELWVYVDKDKGQKIYDSRGLTYSVNNDGSLVALLHYVNDITPPTTSVTLLSRNTNWQAKTYQLDARPKQCNFNPDTSSLVFYPELEKWQQNPSALWGVYTGEYRIVGCYWKLNPENSDVTYYPVPNSQILFALNTDKLVALYDDKPPLVEEYSANQWLSTHSTYNLYLYSLETKQSTKITTFPSNFISSDIGWDSSTQLHYLSPDGKEVYTLPGQ